MAATLLQQELSQSRLKKIKQVALTIWLVAETEAATSTSETAPAQSLK